ncbi:MAG: hypothetical protein KA954_10575 [Chitinophagales bacterium]|nr:hypothetical protein [Chitinophagales bacterium]MBP8755243.1 hypothetical protein [Chitinophagales bacterium]MBP9188009.1 hypothetical protein [Chitinophagales bacterium]MBP9705678.1 hypothetical protein [Chitinophagales bacterium]
MDEINNLLPLIATGIAASCIAILLTSVFIFFILRHFWFKFRKSFQNDLLKYVSNELSDLSLHEKILEPMQNDMLNHFDEFMQTTLPAELPVLKMFIDEKLTEELKVVFNTEMKKALPQILEKNFSESKQVKYYFKEGVRDLANLVTEKLYERLIRKLPLYIFIALCCSVIGAVLAALLAGVIFAQ